MSNLRIGTAIRVPELPGRWSVWSQSNEAPASDCGCHPAYHDLGTHRPAHQETTMTTAPTPLHDVDQLVADLLGVQAHIADLEARAKHLKAQLAERVGTGNSRAVGDVTVTVREPNRRFNLERAWDMLTPEQRQVCFTRDATLVKRQLPEVLLEQCMDEGTGAPIVTVR